MLMKPISIYSSKDYQKNKIELARGVQKMYDHQQMPDQYSSSMLLHGATALGNPTKHMSIKNVNNQYLDAFLLAFFLKDNQDTDSDSMVSAFENYFSKVLRLGASEFLVVLEKISKDLLDLIKEDLVLQLKSQQSNRVREKFYDLDLYQQINTNMLSALVDGKKLATLLKTKLSGFDVISSKDFVGRFFWLNLQKEISDPTLNEQISDNFQISSVKDLIVNCQNRIQKRHLKYLKQLDDCFERQIAKNPSMLDALTRYSKSDANTLSDNLRLMLFFLVGHTVLICLDVMLTTTASQDDSAMIQVGDSADGSDSNRLLLNMSRGMLALGVIGCFIGLLPKK